MYFSLLSGKRFIRGNGGGGSIWLLVAEKHTTSSCFDKNSQNPKAALWPPLVGGTKRYGTTNAILFFDGFS